MYFGSEEAEQIDGSMVFRWSVLMVQWTILIGVCCANGARRDQSHSRIRPGPSGVDGLAAQDLAAAARWTVVN